MGPTGKSALADKDARHLILIFFRTLPMKAAGILSDLGSRVRGQVCTV